MALFSIDCCVCRRLVYVEADVILPHLKRADGVKMELCEQSGKAWRLSHVS